MAVANDIDFEKQFRRITICSSCEGTLSSPKILPCYHSFCLDCLNENARRYLQSGTTPNCQTCKTEFLGLSQVKGVAELPTNGIIDSIIAAADALCPIPKIGLAGFQRRDGSASRPTTELSDPAYRCHDTGRGKSAVPIGRRIGNLFKPGRVEDSRQRCASDKTQRTTFCKKHMKKFDRYCSNCRQVICPLCLRTKHQAHRVNSVESAVKDLHQMIKSYAIWVEYCQANYRVQYNIYEAPCERRTAAATMNGMDCTPVRPDSRSRYVKTKSPSSANRNPFIYPETGTLPDSLRESTYSFYVIITNRALRDDILNMVKELCKSLETWCKLHEQGSHVQPLLNSPSPRYHTSRRDIGLDNCRELEEKEQRTQRAFPEQIEWTTKDKRIEDIVKRQIEETRYMEANRKKQGEWVADELQKPKAKSKLIADRLHRENVISPTHKVSRDKLTKEDLEAAIRELRESNADVKNELAQQLQNERRRRRDLEKLISWIERIDAQSVEFQMTTEGHSDNGIIDKLKVSIVRKLNECSEKERLVFNELQHQINELKSRASSEHKTQQVKSSTREKQFADKIQFLEREIDQLKEDVAQESESKMIAQDELKTAVRTEGNLTAELTDLRQLLGRCITDITDLLRELNNLIKRMERGDTQQTENHLTPEGVSKQIRASAIKTTKDLIDKEKQWTQIIEESGQRINKLWQLFSNADKNHRKIVNELAGMQGRLIEKIRQLENDVRQSNARIQELENQIQSMKYALTQQKESSPKLSEMLQQQVEPKKSHRNKVDLHVGQGQVTPTEANLIVKDTKSKQQRVNTKHNCDNSTAVCLQIAANSLLTQPTLTGIRNMGNTCYFGATMQNLAHTFLLTEELHSSLSNQLPFDVELVLTKKYIEFLSRGYGANCDQTFLRHMFEEFCKKSSRFADRGQHDSHDMFVNFLNCLRDEERRRYGSVNSPGFRNVLTAVDKVFGGHTITVYVCSTCKTPYHVCEPFLDISIPILGPVDGGEDEEEDLFNSHLHSSDTERQVIGYSNSARQAFAFTMTSLGDRSRLKKRSHVSKSEGQFSLEQCLVYYSRIERIHKEYLCSRCVAKERPLMTSALKRTLIYNPPAVLVLHLKRFEQTAVGFKKCNQHVTYDEYLDIGPYCSSNSLRITEPNDVNVWYSLYGVVVHKGSLTSGHYISYIKVRDCDTKETKHFMQQTFLNRDQVLNDDDIRRTNASGGLHTHRKEWKPKKVEGQWYLADDEYIKAVGKTEALSQAAYLLFYERVAKSMDTVI